MLLKRVSVSVVPPTLFLVTVQRFKPVIAKYDIFRVCELKKPESNKNCQVRLSDRPVQDGEKRWYPRYGQPRIVTL